MKKNLKIGLFGGSGKMGQQVQIAIEDLKHAPYFFVGSKKSDIFSFSVLDLENVEKEILNEVDVWIDFSSPKGLKNLLQKTTKTPVVTGTTGFTKAEFNQLKSVANKRPLFWSANMSLGLWALRQSLKGLANLSDFDFVIEETHHKHKKDKPSGTALTLKDDLQKILGKKIETPLAHRIGGVYGIHTIHAASDSEIVTLQHQAINRKVFATGALRAAEWLSHQPNGFYSMDDMFNKRGKA